MQFESRRVEIQGLDLFSMRRMTRLTWLSLAAFALVIPFGFWSLLSLVEGNVSSLIPFASAAAWFVVLGITYCGLHGVRNMAWTSTPVLLTFQALAGFVFIPLLGFARGDEMLDSSYLHAMVLVLIGFVPFWIGSLSLTREAGIRYIPKTHLTSPRIAFICVAMLAFGVLGNLLLWRFGLFSYTADEGSRTSSTGVLRWLETLADMLGYSLVGSAIEVLGKRTSSKLMRLVFWLSIFLSVIFGVLSGTKSGPLRPLVYLVLIYAITRRRFPRAAFLLPFVLVLFIYPFVNAFRNNLNSGYRAQFDSVEGLEQTVSQSFDDAFLSFGASSSSSRQQNISQTTSRLSYLSYVRDVTSLPVPSMLSGDEKLWMAPFYPLVPRFLWKNKPVLDKGRRLSILLGRGGFTSSALTPIGDLGAMYGPYGLALGMLFWGVCLQLYMNWIGGRNPTERSLFTYLLLLQNLLNFEDSYFSLIAGAVQQLMLISFIALLIYGRLDKAGHGNLALTHNYS